MTQTSDDTKPKVGEIWSCWFNKAKTLKEYKITDLSKNKIQLILVADGYRNKQWYPIKNLTLIKRVSND